MVTDDHDIGHWEGARGGRESAAQGGHAWAGLAAFNSQPHALCNPRFGTT